MKFHQLDCTKLSLSSTMVVIGKRHSGKSLLITDLMYNLSKEGGLNNQTIDLVVVFSNTEELQNNFSRFIPTAFIHSSYSEQKINDVLNVQKQLIKSQGRTSNIIIILDDLAFDKRIFSETLTKFFFNARHYKLGIIISLQYSMQLPTALRSNCDVVFAMKEPIVKNRKKLYDEFYGLFSNYNEFDKSFSEITEDYGSMVILNNSSASCSVENNIFWYRATPDEIPDKFQVGRSVFYDWSHQYMLKEQHRINGRNSVIQVYNKPNSRPLSRPETNTKFYDEQRQSIINYRQSEKKHEKPLSIIL